MTAEEFLTHRFVPQATVMRPPAFFEPLGASFDRDRDDLNEYEVAKLNLDGTPFALMRYAGTAADRTDLFLPDTVPLESVAQVVDAILKAFDLSGRSIWWLRKTNDTPFTPATASALARRKAALDQLVAEAQELGDYE